MTEGGTNGRIDRLVKARWLQIGLSQSDLAEVLNAAFQPPQSDGNGTNGTSARRLMQVAEALEIPAELLQSDGVGTEPEPVWISGALQSLLELRLLRAFQELRDQRTRHVLVRLAEQIVKRQTGRHGEAG